MKKTVYVFTITALVGIALIGCTTSYDPNIDPANFVGTIYNQYFPLIPGTTFVYEGSSEDGSERNEVYVTFQTREIMGVTCTVVHDRVWINGELEEETFDWYAQDKEGTVWYFGEDSKEYANGEVVSTDGSWEAGVDGAKPGIIMPGSPAVTQRYRQEYYEGEAEDWAEVLSLTESVSVVYGSYENCLQTLEWTPLEPGFSEHKFYVAGVGMLLETVTTGGWGQLELVEITTD